MLWELAETLDLKANLQLWGWEEEKEAEDGRQEKWYRVPALGIRLQLRLDFPDLFLLAFRLSCGVTTLHWKVCLTNQTLFMGHNQQLKPLLRINSYVAWLVLLLGTINKHTNKCIPTRKWISTDWHSRNGVSSEGVLYLTCFCEKDFFFLLRLKPTGQTIRRITKLLIYFTKRLAFVLHTS